jgi:hypothetical protein
MAYNNSIPQAGDLLSQSQADILANFQEIDTFVTLNHVTFGASDAGKHKFLQMPVQVAAPSTAAGEMGLYTKTSALTSVPEMFVRKQSNGTEIEFTSALANANGWTRLPSGILLKWGTSGSVSVNSSDALSFPVAGTIPVFSNVFSAQVSLNGGNTITGNVFVTTLTTTTLTVYYWSTAAVATTYRYLVIGN